MRLTLQSQEIDDVMVIRCSGRIVAGAEVEALQAEVEKQTKIPGTNLLAVSCVLLNLAGTEYIDSSGLGALVRMLRVLQAAGGDLKLCELSPTVVRVLEVTNMSTLFLVYGSEQEALAAFTRTPRAAGGKIGSAKGKIVCIDTSSDLLAVVHALLTRAGYEVFTTRYVGDAAKLVHAMRPHLIVCGPGMQAVPTSQEAMEQLHKTHPDMKILNLPAGFSTAEAGEAGVELVKQVEALTA